MYEEKINTYQEKDTDHIEKIGTENKSSRIRLYTWGNLQGIKRVIWRPDKDYLITGEVNSDL